MNYRINRLDPFRNSHPLVLAAVVLGGLTGLMAYQAEHPYLGGAGACVAVGSVLFGARPLVCALLAALGLLTGIFTFLLTPNANVLEMSLAMRLASTAAFTFFYVILMGALVLLIAALYNFFRGALGLNGVELDLKSMEDETTYET